MGQTTIVPAGVEIVRRFSRQRVLAIGDAMLDSYLEGTATRLCKEGPVPVVRKDTAEHAPGGAANSAANLAALGADVMLVALVGTDAAGRDLRVALRAAGVDDGWLVEDPAIETVHKTRVIANGQYLVRFDEGQTRGCSPEARDRLRANIAAAHARCDAIVVADYGYGVAGQDVIETLRGLQAGAHRPLAVDAREIGRFRLAGATIVTPNYQEACLAAELRDGRGEPGAPVDLAAAEEAGRALLQRIDAEYAAITLAGDGVLLLDRAGRVAHLPVHPVVHAGDVGAGDTFTAALALALAAGAGVEQAARLGIDAAGIAITKRRTAVVHQAELLRRVSLDDQASTLSRKELAARMEADRFAGKRIVFTNGVFDILHAGHVQLLRRARALGDVLVVGVNSDASTRRLKGPTRPINHERDRAALVNALDGVDHVIVFAEDSPTDLMRAIRPHVHVKGGDYVAELLPEAAVAEEIGAEVVILPFEEGRSTTNVIDRIATLVHGGAVPAAS